MEIGTGLAIIGIWLFPVACAMSTQVHGSFMKSSSIVAVILTVILILSDAAIASMPFQ